MRGDKNYNYSYKTLSLMFEELGTVGENSKYESSPRFPGSNILKLE